MFEQGGLWDSSNVGTSLKASIVDQVHGSRIVYVVYANRDGQKNG